MPVEEKTGEKMMLIRICLLAWLLGLSLRPLEAQPDEDWLTLPREVITAATVDRLEQIAQFDVTLPQPPHNGYWIAHRFSGDGRYLAASFALDIDRRVVSWWDMTSGDSHTGQLYETDSWNAVLFFSPDNVALVTSGQGGWLRLWDVETGSSAPLRYIQQPAACTDNQIHSALFAFDAVGTLLAYGSCGDRLLLWRARGGEVVRQMQQVRLLSILDDGTVLVTDREHIYNLVTGEVVDGLARLADEMRNLFYFGVIFNRDLTRAVVRFDDATPTFTLGMMWDVRASRALYEVTRSEGMTANFSFNPGGDLLLYSGGSNQFYAHIRDAANGSLLRSIEPFTAPVSSLGFSPDGTLLVIATTDGRLWLYGIRD